MRRGKKIGRSDHSFLRILPWWAPSLFAFFILFIVLKFHWYIRLPGYKTEAIVNAVDTVIHSSAVIRGFSGLIFMIGMTLSFKSLKNNYRRSRLVERQKKISDLSEMSWQDFEILVAECYRRYGYKVIENGLGGADGGIDLILMRGSDKIIVQCKHWKKGNVGAPVVREMYGLMTHCGASRVKIICCGGFTREAWNFSRGKPIDLIGGEGLMKLLAEVQRNQ